MANPYFPPATIKKMAGLGISESDVLDVFYKGEYITKSDGTKMAIKKYTYHEIGLFYGVSKDTGEYVIITVWKRARR